MSTEYDSFFSLALHKDLGMTLILDIQISFATLNESIVFQTLRFPL